MKVKRVIKCCCIFAALILATVLLLIGCFIYSARYKIADIDSATSPDGRYKIIFQAVGEPDFPFGDSHARIVLKSKNETVTKYNFDVANDGGILYPENWTAEWQSNCVLVTVFGEEQKDTLYTFWFDGKTDVEIIDEDSNIRDIKKDVFLKQKANIKQFDVNVLENRENELVFDFTIDDYIESFNGYYFCRNKKRYILPTSFDNWQTETLETSIHSPHETMLYNYSADRTVWSLPTIYIYVPTDSDCVQEITLDFDWHGYSEKLYELYNEMCYCTLKVFFSDLSDEQITKIYSKSNQLGYDNVFSSDEWYSKDSVPCALFYKDGIGIYSHSAIGSYQRLCIIPVTEKTVKEFEQKGTEIYEIE